MPATATAAKAMTTRTLAACRRGFALSVMPRTKRSKPVGSVDEPALPALQRARPRDERGAHDGERKRVGGADEQERAVAVDPGHGDDDHRAHQHRERFG